MNFGGNKSYSLCTVGVICKVELFSSCLGGSACDYRVISQRCNLLL